MEILVTNLQQKLPVNVFRIKNLARKILKKLKKSPQSICVVFVGDNKIRQLNKMFFKKSYTTDVLSFEDWEIVICADTAIKNAKLYKTSADFEIKLYLIHGILHLLGYDDNNEKNKRLMRLKEKQILAALDNKI